MSDFSNDSDFRMAVERVLHALIDQIDDIDADDFDSPFFERCHVVPQTAGLNSSSPSIRFRVEKK